MFFQALVGISKDLFRCFVQLLTDNQIKMTFLFLYIRISQKLWKCFLLAQVNTRKSFLSLKLMLQQFLKNPQKALTGISVVQG